MLLHLHHGAAAAGNAHLQAGFKIGRIAFAEQGCGDPNKTKDSSRYLNPHLWSTDNGKLALAAERTFVTWGAQRPRPPEPRTRENAMRREKLLSRMTGEVLVVVETWPFFRYRRTADVEDCSLPLHLQGPS